MDVSVWWEQVVHDDEVDLLTIGHFDSVQPVELREQRVGVLFDMSVVVLQDLAQEFVLGVVNCLNDVLVVP